MLSVAALHVQNQPEKATLEVDEENTTNVSSLELNPLTWQTQSHSFLQLVESVQCMLPSAKFTFSKFCVLFYEKEKKTTLSCPFLNRSLQLRFLESSPLLTVDANINCSASCSAQPVCWQQISCRDSTHRAGCRG